VWLQQFVSWNCRSHTQRCAHIHTHTHTYTQKTRKHTKTQGRPHIKVTPNSANKLFTQFKAPYTSSECKILDVISKSLTFAGSIPLTFAGNLAFWGVLWGLVRILHPLLQGKGAFLKLPRSTSASGDTYHKCCIAMLQGRIWGRSTGKASEWEALTQARGTGEKDKKNQSVHTCCEFQLDFCSQSCGVTYIAYIKLKWGQSMAWLNFVQIRVRNMQAIFRSQVKGKEVPGEGKREIRLI